MSVLPRRALPYGWKTKEGGADLRLRLHPSLTIGGGFDRLIVDRTFREVDRTIEDTVRGSVDWRWTSWFALRGLIAGSHRRGSFYDPDAYLQTYPDGAPSEMRCTCSF